MCRTLPAWALYCQLSTGILSKASNTLRGETREIAVLVLMSERVVQAPEPAGNFVWFGLARQVLFPMEYAPVFCGTNLLSLDELQVNGEGDGNTEMLGYSDICSDNDDSEVVSEANSDHSAREYSARCSKSGNSKCIFQVPKQSKFSAGLNQDQQWVILGERDRKSTRLNSSHVSQSRMPSSA